MDLQFGEYRLKRRERQLTGPNGAIELSARSFDILETLLTRPNELIDKQALFDAVWPGVVVEENTLQVHVSALRKVLGPELIATVHGRGYKYAGPVPLEIADGKTTTPESQARKPVIAVLPFGNLSGDPNQQYFSDGITEDIIDRLAKFRILSVIGHHSSFALRGRESEIGEVRNKLSADYVLTGNIRKSAGRIRIAARLIDARSEGAMWADHYDRPLEDIFAVQDEVASIIVNTLLGRVEIEVGARQPAASPASISSFEHVLQGIWHFKKLTPASNAIAAGCFQKAIDAHPGNAEAYRWLAICDNGEWLFDFSRAGLVNCQRHAAHAIELDPANAGCHAVQGFCQMWLEGLEQAASSYRKALTLNPGDPHVLAEMGLLNVFAGDVPASREFFIQAFKLNPLPPLWYPEFRAVAVFVEGRYAEALPPFLAVPEGAWDTMYALSCLGHLERREHAIALRSRFHAAGHKWDLLAGAAAEPFGNPEPRQRLIEGLKRALSF